MEQWIQYGAGGERLMLNIRLGLAEEESLNTSRRTKQNLSAIKQKGYYVGSLPPKGFSKIVLPNHRKSLEPDGTDTLIIIAHTFKSFLYGNVARGYFLHSGKQLGFSRSKFYELFKNPVYAGLNRVEQDGMIEYVKANWFEHRIIEPEEWQMMQKKINKQANSPSKTIKQNGKYWLKGHLFDLEGVRMSASASKGRSRRYTYYHSMRKGSKNIPVAVAHNMIFALFGRIKLKKEVLEYVEQVIRQNLKLEDKDRRAREATIKRDLTAIDKRLKEINRQYALGDIELGEFRELKNIIEEQKEERLIKLDKIDTEVFINERIITESIKLIPNLKSFIRTGTQEVRSLILNTFFPNGIFCDLEKGQIGTPYLNQMVTQLIDIQHLSKYMILEKVQPVKTVPLGVEEGTQMESIQRDIINLTRLTKLMQSA